MKFRSIIFIFIAVFAPFFIFAQNNSSEKTEELDPYFLEESTNTVWNPRVAKKNQKPIKPICSTESAKKETSKENPFSPSWISFGGSYSYAHISPSQLPSDHGWLYGLQMSYQYQIPNKLSFGGYVSWRQGLTECLNSSRFLNVIDVHERIGYCLGSFKKERLANFFTGFGYRLNAEHVKTPSESVHFDYNNFYIPIGFTFSGRVYPVIYFGTSIMWMPQIYPTLNIEPLKGARWSLTYRFANLRLEAPVTFKTNTSSLFSIQLNPYFEYWQNGHTYAKSQLGTKLTVPSNNYLYLGFELNLRYAF